MKSNLKTLPELVKNNDGFHNSENKESKLNKK